MKTLQDSEYKKAYLKAGIDNGYPEAWLRSQFGTMDFEIQELAAEMYASQFREPSSPTVKESETGEQEEIMKALEDAKCLDPESENWSYHAASRIALEAIKKTRKPLDR